MFEANSLIRSAGRVSETGGFVEAKGLEVCNPSEFNGLRPGNRCLMARFGLPIPGVAWGEFGIQRRGDCHRWLRIYGGERLKVYLRKFGFLRTIIDDGIIDDRIIESGRSCGLFNGSVNCTGLGKRVRRSAQAPLTTDNRLQTTTLLLCGPWDEEAG